MKKYAAFFLFLLLSCFSYGKAPNKPVNQRQSARELPGTVLLSYQRSGAHWLTYCLYRLAVHHIIDYNRHWGDFNKLIPKLPPNPKATRPFVQTHVVQAHGGKGLYKCRRQILSKERDVLIFLIRDYKECYPRNDPDDPLLLLTEQKLHYFQNLEVYHNWSAERRYIVYYEDLIQNLEGTLFGLLKFLGEPVDGIPKFLANLDEHRQFIMNAYDKKYGSQSKGEDVHYHAKKIDPDLLNQLDELVVARYPHLVPYLERYLP